MRSRWSDEEARSVVERLAPVHGEDLALRVYTSRLLGSEPSLVLHGGGNTSVKGTARDLLGREVATLHVKGSGHDLASIGPEGFAPVDLDHLVLLRAVPDMSEEQMLGELCTHVLRRGAPTPSIETLVHAWIPGRFVDHTHADAVLTLTNRPGGEAAAREAFGEGVVVLPYAKAGFELARAAAEACERHPGSVAMVLARHGLLTWGATAKESYERTIACVDRAERLIAARSRPVPVPASPTDEGLARERAARVAPIVRGALAVPSGSADRPHERRIVRLLSDRATLDFLDAPGARELALSPAITPDHVIRTRVLPLWIDDLPSDGGDADVRARVSDAVAGYGRTYAGYLERHGGPEAARRTGDLRPRVVLVPGLGAFCAGVDAAAADVARDVTRQTLAVKRAAAALGGYEGLPEGEVFAMEFLSMQQAKLARRHATLGSEVVLVTGAAGAIGSGVCRGLLEAGAHVVATDLPGGRLDSLVAALAREHAGRVTGVPLDVTDPESVAAAFSGAALAFGGVDVVVVNAGLAHVSSLEEMDLDRYRRLQAVNVEGTLLVLRETARHLRRQGTGGDVVLVSTKNVFAPGAKFGAYSATKAAAHQLARIASLELAGLDVRVNMVAPDAVFSDGDRRSGLWQEVGPDRMKARGLDEAELEEYYRKRNLLEARITPDHVARAVLFFATRQTPTTGVTLPVDGGLPDATPR